MKASYKRYVLNFKRPGGTSRGVLTQKETWFIIIEDQSHYGIGECGILRKLSIDDRPDYEEKLDWTCKNITLGKEKLWEALKEFPSIQFGVEQAFVSLKNQQPQGKTAKYKSEPPQKNISTQASGHIKSHLVRRSPFQLFPSDFSTGKAAININGLVWMGDEAFMREQITEKIAAGFGCIKMKIGAIDFETELKLLQSIRKTFSAKEIELRVDANGAFAPNEALDKLRRLSELELHSIEQPIKQGQWEEMAALCRETPLPIALDEELIGVFDVTKKKELLQTIKPQYIILKPSLVGGYRGAEEWINLCEGMNIYWWITSALESNIGLNAIAQWTYTLNNNMPQGLGTGSLFTNNIESPLEVKNGALQYNSSREWNWQSTIL
ncbi:o-succinylbenzoate synthase [Galbibacter sp. EGI 63066]|uniref:o-succinylbenzoate synthase n=1 Tax=Galbibacter sp. EGI 63066 TaxID=2993559 RepID=UPI0022493B2E|nr:o-succinylbenzoate synthase [Galbibacter sp. EGI 63066]MCX2680127.1 o-succinylbenzoate synthase [Galbibacter sp. EGI 63066]